MLFSKRKQLADEFEAWAAKHNAERCALNVITFLDSKDLLAGSSGCFIVPPGFDDATKHTRLPSDFACVPGVE